MDANAKEKATPAPQGMAWADVVKGYIKSQLWAHLLALTTISFF